MALLRILNVDLALNEASFEKHLTCVLKVQEGLGRSAVLGKPIEGFKANFQRRYGLGLQTSCLSSELHASRRIFLSNTLKGNRFVCRRVQWRSALRPPMSVADYAALIRPTGH